MAQYLRDLMESSRTYGSIRQTAQEFQDSESVEDNGAKESVTTSTGTVASSTSGTTSSNTTRTEQEGTTTQTMGELVKTQTSASLTTTQTSNQHHGIRVNMRLRFHSPHATTPTP